jgi:hypothetical protein
VSGRPDLARRAATEALGAFALVFAGRGAIVTDTVHAGSLGAVGVSLVFGLVIMAMVYATGHLSGAHLNPAVTTDTRAVGAGAAIAIGGAVGPRRPLRRPDHRRLDEPGPLDRPGAHLRRTARPLDLHRRPDHRRPRPPARAGHPNSPPTGLKAVYFIAFRPVDRGG